MASSLCFSVKYKNFKDVTIIIRVYASIRDQVYISLEKTLNFELRKNLNGSEFWNFVLT